MRYSSANHSGAPHRVAIVGCGFAGLFAAKALRREPVEVTVVDRTNHHLFQPLLYQMATGILSAGEIAPPIRDVLRRQRNATVVLGEVEDIDLAARRLHVSTLGLVSEIPYDSLIVATGAEQSYFGHPEFARDAPGMKTIDDALELRGRIFGAFEMAEREPDPDVQRSWLTFVVVGAGPTGWSWPDRSPSSRTVPCSTTTAGSIPRALASCCSTGPRRCSGRSRSRCSTGPPATSSEWASRSTSARWSRVSTSAGSTPTPPTRRCGGSTQPRRCGPPASRPRRWVGSSPRRGGRGRPRRPGPGAAGLHAARTSRGVRRRRPDGAGPPTGARTGRDPVRPPRREHDRPPSAW